MIKDVIIFKLSDIVVKVLVVMCDYVILRIFIVNDEGKFEGLVIFYDFIIRFIKLCFRV